MAVIFEETVIVRSESQFTVGECAYNSQLTDSKLKITFNGVSYICDSHFVDAPDVSVYYYGGFSESGPVFNEYPFVLESIKPTLAGFQEQNKLYTETPGTYTIKVETVSAVNKVVFGEEILIDLTSDTVTPETLLEGYTAHDKSGKPITGTATSGGRIWKDENGYVHLSDDGNLVGVEPLTVTENGTYTAPAGKAYSPITVDVSGGVPYEPRSDGKNHLWFDVWDADMPIGVPLSSGTNIVDWGDGTTENYKTSGLKQHAYSKAGIYEVTITNSNYSIGSYQNNGTTVEKCNLIAAELARKPSGSGTFHQCPSLRWVYMSDGASSAGEYSHYSMFHQDMSLAFVRLPNDMVDISGAMFQYCYTLNTISIPSTVTHIYSYAFSDCSNLESITLPEGLLTIDASAFQRCVKLLTLTIPASVTTIGNYAFAYRPKALEYHFLSTTPPTLGSANAFQSIGENCKIYVPSASLEAYQTATNWSTYASYMQGE